MALAEDLRGNEKNNNREKPLSTLDIREIIQAFQFTFKESRTFLLSFLSLS